MVKGLESYLFSIPVQAGEIVEVFDKGQRLKVRTCEDHDGPETVEIALSRGMAFLKRPSVGHFLVQYPHGHLDILDPVQFAAKATCGGANVH